MGCPVVSTLSEELDTKLMAQPVSCSAGIAQSHWERLRCPVGRPEEVPAPCEDVGGRSGVISGVDGRQYWDLRNSEAL